MSSSGRRSGVAAFAVLLIAVLVSLVRRSRPAQPAGWRPPESISTPEAETPQPSQDRPRRSRARWLLVLLALAAGAWSAVRITDFGSPPHLQLAIGTATIVISAFCLRGPFPRYGAPVYVLLALCVAVGISLVLANILISADPEDGDIYLLVISALCAIVGVAAIAWCLSTWNVRRAVVEPAALVVTAVLLGGISLLGLYSAGTTIEPADVYGSGSLYLSRANLDAELDVSSPNPEYRDIGVRFVVTTSKPAGGRPARWALVLTGAARIRADTINRDDVTVREGRGNEDASFPPDRPPQVVEGSLQQGRAEFSARLLSPIAARSASRTAVTFPSYGAGTRYGLDEDERALLEAGDRPITRPPRSLHVALDAGSLFGLQTVTQADPPLENPHQLTWQADDQLGQVSYATFDQSADDIARNKLFAVAIFLGTAAACLISAMQSILARSRQNP